MTVPACPHCLQHPIPTAISPRSAGTQHIYRCGCVSGDWKPTDGEALASWRHVVGLEIPLASTRESER
jgi:hypothetical protein